MKHKILASTLASVLFLTTSPVALMQTRDSGQTAPDATAQDWQDLQDLKPGKRILVELKSGFGDQLEGKFVSAIGTQLTLSQDRFQFTVKQSEIKRVYRQEGRWSRSGTIRIGAGVGMATGTFIGVYKYLQPEVQRPTQVTDGSYTPPVVYMLVGSLVGAGIGALVGGKRKGNLLYEAK